MTTGIGFVNEAPEEDNIDEKCGGRMEKIMCGDPPGIVEVGIVNDILHHATGILLKRKAIICQCSP